MPFVCAKYRAVVRVVDFYPNKLEDFACSRQASEFDVLSDNSGDSSDESDDSAGESSPLYHSSSIGGRVERIWEWRFALCLEDAAPQGRGRPKNRFWAMVDNPDAQLLTSLDACE